MDEINNDAVSSYVEESSGTVDYIDTTNYEDVDDLCQESQGDESEESDDENDHWRVKVYYMDEHGLWTDIGTGFATCRQVRLA